MFFDVHTHSADKSSNCIYNLKKDDQVKGCFSAGIHPWVADQFADHIEWLKSISNDPRCVAIGEAGLDKIKGPDLETQTRAFMHQIELSEELEIPLVIHCVKTWNELRSIKREVKPKQPWIFHGFSKAAIAQEVLEEGLIISIGTAILTNKQLQEELKKLPLDKILLETDESTASIYEVYQKVSALKNIPLPDLEREIENTFKRTFKEWITG